jgi:hypothetical protein
MIYRSLIGDISRLRLVSKTFWEELCDEVGKTATHVLDMREFIANYLRDRIVLLESETMISADWLFNQHGCFHHRRRLPLYAAPIDIEYCQNVRHLHVQNFCLFADNYIRMGRLAITCAPPSSGYGITHLRYAFPNLRTVSCSCSKAEVEWSNYAGNDSCVRYSVPSHDAVASAIIIPPMTGLLPLFHGWQQMALKARLLPDKGVGTRSLSYQLAARKRCSRLQQLAGEPDTQQRNAFEEQLQSELNKALVHSPDHLQTSSDPFPKGYCEKRWPTAKCIINEIIDQKHRTVPYLQRKNRSFYKMQKVDGRWKWVFIEDKFQKAQSRRISSSRLRQRLDILRK